MNGFETNWGRCVARARDQRAEPESAPLGFAGRVLAAVRAGSADAASLEVIWQRLTMRSLRWIGVCLLVCALFELPHLRERKALATGIENTVGQLVWSL